jgi:large subunit ribosomal protein L17
MRHKKARLQLNRFTSWHDATIASLVRNLLIYQSINTTLHRAKAAQPLAEKLISKAKDDSIASRRLAYKVLGDHKLVSVLFKDIGPRFTKRQGGYTRIVNLGNRRGDDASMVIWELTEIKAKEARKPKKAKEEKPEDQGPETELTKETPTQETHGKPEAHEEVKEKHPVDQKPPKKFLGGIKNIFKKERDSL